MTWALEKEICKCGETEVVGRALENLGIIESAKDEFWMNQKSEWIRSGAETYGLIFGVQVDGQIEKNFFMKACVAIPIGKTTDEIIRVWVQKRRIFEYNGGNAPQLYYHGHGLIIEEFIKYEFLDTYRIREEKRRPLSLSASELAFSLSQSCLSFFQFPSDARTRGSDCVLVDFGEDLFFDHSTNSEALYQQHIKKLRSMGIDSH